MRVWTRALTALVATVGGLQAQGALAADPARWMTTLSWSPEYCEQHRNSVEPQCIDEHYFVNVGLQVIGQVGDAKLGDACPRSELKPVDEGRWLFSIPNLERIRYVWTEQGACSGLDQGGYYAQMDYAARKVEIPPEYTQADRRKSTSPAEMRALFAKQNPEMIPESLQLQCDARWLSEIRVCFDQSMQFAQCPVAGNCSEQIWLRPIRPDRKGADSRLRQ